MFDDSRMTRRAVTGAAGGMFASGTAPLFAANSADAPATWIDVRTRGAKGDGKTEDTKALQSAIDAAAAAGTGGVWIPPGTYLTGTLQLGRGITLAGAAGWNYRGMGGSVLRLKDAAASCLLDITGAIGCSIQGLSLDGEKLGSDVHGVFLNKPD